jgi:alkanesulfonate monooxygenase SsuD/methylene tetrahydromethanopterin reductase-like flavin-dependent oxidoreductase (luciferase family)
VRFGVVILPDRRWSEARRSWRRVEELGFDHAWTYDHLSWRSLRDEAWLGAVPTLAAAALETSRVRLGTLVASPNFRHPVPFAKELLTLDDLSGGRLTAGLGAGGSGLDASVLGGEPWSAKERGRRFEEFVELLDRQLREPETSFQGAFYSAHEARTYPGCVQRPRVPFAIAASGPRGMRLAARHGQAWVTLDRLELRAQLEGLARACHELGRDPATLDRLLLTGTDRARPLDSLDAFRACAEHARELGFSDLVVHHPRASDPFAADPATFERIATEALPELR